MNDILETLYNLMGLVFVLGTIVSMGLGLTMNEIVSPLRNVRFVIVALVVNFVVIPLAAFLLLQLFALDETLVTGILLVSLAAGAPSLPKMAEFAHVDKGIATSLMVLLVVATIIILPIILPLLLTDISVTFWDIASGLVMLILIPLAISLFIRARYEEVALNLQLHFTQASTFSLLALMVLMVILNFENVMSLLGTGGLLVSLFLVLISVASGYLLGSAGNAHNWIQALGAGQRNIAAAMVVATMNFSSSEVIMVVVYSLITLVVMTPLSLELGKRNAVQPATAS